MQGSKTHHPSERREAFSDDDTPPKQGCGLYRVCVCVHAREFAPSALSTGTFFFFEKITDCSLQQRAESISSVLS